MSKALPFLERNGEFWGLPESDQQAINELNASGAEAVSINGQRIISRTPIRCVGPTAIVNDVRTASPFEIRAVGNPDTLWGGLNLPDGYIDTMFRAYDPDMCRIEKRKSILVPGYTGSTEIRYAKAADSAVKHGATPRSDSAAATVGGNAATSPDSPEQVAATSGGSGNRKEGRSR